MIDMFSLGDTLAISIVSGLTATILALIALQAFNIWIDLKRGELGRHDTATPPIAGRIEVADLRERVRRLEAIAAGVEL